MYLKVPHEDQTVLVSIVKALVFLTDTQGLDLAIYASNYIMADDLCTRIKN